MHSPEAKELIFSKKEIKFLRELRQRRVPFMVVGLAAAAMQGAPIGTQDVDLWFKDLSDPRVAKAIKKAGGFYVPPMIQMQTPPRFAGKDFQLLDIVTHMTGLKSFDKEYKKAKMVKLGNLTLKILPLERIIHGKKKTGRPKDKLALPALEETLRCLQQAKKRRR